MDLAKKDDIQQRYIELISKDSLTEDKISEKLMKEFSIKLPYLQRVITDEVKKQAEEEKERVYREELKREIKKSLKSLTQGVYPPENLKEQVGAAGTLYKIYKDLSEEDNTKQIELKTTLTYEDVKDTEKILKNILSEMVKDEG